MNNIVKRTTLIVRDIEASARWYEVVLGMNRYYDNEIVLPGTGLAAGEAGRQRASDGLPVCRSARPGHRRRRIPSGLGN